MEPTSGYSLSVSSQKRDSVLSTPSNHQATLMHLDSEDYSKAENVRPSYFSDEEDDPDNINLHDSQNMEAKNQATDILKLADREDGLKVSRATLVHRLTTFKEISTLGEIIHEVNEDLHRSSSIENELPLPEMSNITSIADSLTGMESFTRQNSSKDSSIVLEDIAKSISGTEELTIRPKSQSQGPTNLNVKPVPCNVEPKRELCVIQGVLRKKSPNFLSMWQDRYAVLKDKKLLYYKNDRADNPLGCLDFDLFASTVRVSTKHPKQFIIAPTGSDRTFTFKASSPEERRKWTDALEQHIRASEGRRLLNTSIAIKKNFWKHDRISEIKFLSEAKTGDLLLFRTQNIAAKLQRSMTRSEYDHVGLILKNGDGSIVLFEATGGDGVGLCRWSAFKSYSWHILYEKVVYRKLIVERTRDLIDRAENFVKSTVGKKYSVSPKKLLQRKSTSIAIDTPQDRTFFCSELVAACYKRMGLLPNTISSSQYLPGTFAADKKLSLIGGAKLGEEFLVNFNIQ